MHRRAAQMPLARMDAHELHPYTDKVLLSRKPRHCVSFRREESFLRMILWGLERRPMGTSIPHMDSGLLSVQHDQIASHLSCVIILAVRKSDLLSQLTVSHGSSANAD
jgi:hypothetical protein